MGGLIEVIRAHYNRNKKKEILLHSMEAIHELIVEKKYTYNEHGNIEIISKHEDCRVEVYIGTRDSEYYISIYAFGNRGWEDRIIEIVYSGKTHTYLKNRGRKIMNPYVKGIIMLDKMGYLQ